MENVFSLALGRPQGLEHRTAAEKKKLPFYMVTADPFGVLEKWEKLSQDPSFMDALKWVIELNDFAIKQNEDNSGVWNHVHYGFERPERPIRIHGADISLIGLMISLEKTIKTQKRISSMIWFLASADLSSLRELFETVSRSKPRTYHDTMIWVLTWFYKVRYQFYEFDVKSAREEEFHDFERLGWSSDGIKERVKYLSNGKMFLDVGRGAELVFDFKNATTELVICDWNREWLNMRNALLENNPFQNQDRVNILFPLGCAGWTIPLINLTRITVEHWNGREKMSITFQAVKNPKLQSWVQSDVQWLIEKK